MYIDTPFNPFQVCIGFFIGPHMDIEQEDNKPFVSNTPRINKND